MTRYVIEDTTLTALGDAVRSKIGVEGTVFSYYEEGFFIFSSKSKYIDMTDAPNNRFRLIVSNVVFETGPSNHYECKITLGPDTIKFNLDNTSYNGIVKGGKQFRLEKIGGGSVTMDIAIECVDENDENYTYSPAQMIEKINSILPGPSGSEMVFTGSLQGRFAYDSWNWYLDKYKDYLSSKDVTSLYNMCSYSTYLKEIPFDINCSPTSNCDMTSAFNSCSLLRTVPMIRNAKPGNMCDMFNNCNNIIYFPEGFADDWNWSNSDAGTGPYSGVQMDGIFSGCKKLRQLPMNILAHGNPYANQSYATYNSLAWNCYALDEIIDLPYPHTKATFADTSSYSNLFYNMVIGCGRLKDLTFAEMDPVQWASQTLDLSQYTGWAQYMNLDSDRPGGITADKQVTDDATYQALKDDPDWWTNNVAYSRYNHDSAVRTINSLPSAIEYQTSSGKGANVIKFKGEAGSATDGGAINTLTEEEIAVAAAKGWTVTLV